MLEQTGAMFASSYQQRDEGLVMLRWPPGNQTNLSPTAGLACTWDISTYEVSQVESGSIQSLEYRKTIGL